jgi:hypothetical protein
VVVRGDETLVPDALGAYAGGVRRTALPVVGRADELLFVDLPAGELRIAIELPDGGTWESRPVAPGTRLRVDLRTERDPVETLLERVDFF